MQLFGKENTQEKKYLLLLILVKLNYPLMEMERLNWEDPFREIHEQFEM